MAKTAKMDAPKIAKAWRHSFQRIDDNNGVRPPASTTKTAKIKSNKARRIGKNAGPGWRTVPSGRCRLSQITKTAKKASTVPEARSVVVNMGADFSKTAQGLPEDCLLVRAASGWRNPSPAGKFNDIVLRADHGSFLLNRPD